MKKILTYVLLIFSIKIFATNYYVATDGSGDYTSIVQVNAATFSPGDSILFKRGDTFTGTLIPTNSGTSGNTIVYGAYGTGNKPLFNGLTEITSWSDNGGNIWYATSSAKASLNMVVKDGFNTAKGSWPNADDATDGGYANADSHTSTSLTDATLTGTPDYTGATVWVRDHHFYLDSRTITSQSTSTLNWSGALTYNWNTTDGYIITDALSTLDQEGEWYFNGTNFYMYFSDDNPTNNEVFVSIRDTGIYFNNVDYVTIENIELRGYNEFAVTFNGGAEHTTIQNCDINFNGNYAILGHNDTGSGNGYQYLTVDNCSIQYTNSCAIALWREFDNATITNCYIYSTFMFPHMRDDDGTDEKFDVISVADKSTGLEVSGTKIINSGSNPIATNGVGDLLIENCYIDSFNIVLDDGGGIYSYYGGTADTATNKIYRNNIVLHGIGAPYGTTDDLANSNGIYLDAGSSNTIIQGNLSAYNVRWGHVSNLSDNIEIRDNIYFENNDVSVTGNSAMFLNAYSFTGFISNYDIKNNIFYHSATSMPLIYLLDGGGSYVDIGDCDSNIYITNSANFWLGLSGWGSATGNTLSEWQSSTGEDLNSTVLNVTPQLRYNATMTPIIAFADSSGTLVDGTIFTNGVALDAFESVVAYNVTANTQSTSVNKVLGWKGFVLGWKGTIIGTKQ